MKRQGYEVKCTNCNDVLWVCENHPDKSWDANGCECGAGMPCPECNASDSREDVPKMPPGFEEIKEIH